MQVPFAPQKTGRIAVKQEMAALDFGVADIAPHPFWFEDVTKKGIETAYAKANCG